MDGTNHQTKQLAKLFSVDRRTLKRWQHFWNELFPKSKLVKLIKERVPMATIFPGHLIEAITYPELTCQSLILLLNLFKNFSHYFKGGIFYAEDAC